MRPVDQDRVSNCWEACIASILERPLADFDALHDLRSAYFIPARSGNHDFAKRKAYQIELRRLGFGTVSMTSRDTDWFIGLVPKGYAIANGPGHRGLQHSCVALDGVIVHDPHASRAGLLRIEDFQLVMPVMPTALPPDDA